MPWTFADSINGTEVSATAAQHTSPSLHVLHRRSHSYLCWWSCTCIPCQCVQHLLCAFTLVQRRSSRLCRSYAYHVPASRIQCSELAFQLSAWLSSPTQWMLMRSRLAHLPGNVAGSLSLPCLAWCTAKGLTCWQSPYQSCAEGISTCTSSLVSFMASALINLINTLCRVEHLKKYTQACS